MDNAVRLVTTPWNGEVIEVTSAERILPANATAVDVVVSLVDAARITALPGTSNTYSVIADDPEPWARVPRLEVYESESVLTLDPDVVLVNPWQDEATSDVLRRAGACVVTAPSEATWPAIESYVRVVAEILDTTAAGERLLAGLAERRAQLDATSEPRRTISALTYSNSGTGGWTAGSNSSAHTFITTAGLENAAAAHGIDGHSRIEFETLIQWDPDVIIVALGHSDAPSPTAALLREEPALASLSAVRHDRIVELPAALYNTVSHRLLDASEALAAATDAMFEHTPQSKGPDR